MRRDKEMKQKKDTTHHLQEHQKTDVRWFVCHLHLHVYHCFFPIFAPVLLVVHNQQLHAVLRAKEKTEPTSQRVQRLEAGFIFLIDTKTRTKTQ